MVRILFVDDEPDVELMIRQGLRKLTRDGRIELFFSHDGKEALEMLEKEKGIELVFTDINMPVMTGLELLSNLRTRSSKVIPVVISAYDDTERRQMAFNNGAIDFLTKPLNFSTLENTMQKTIELLTRRNQGIKKLSEKTAFLNS